MDEEFWIQGCLLPTGGLQPGPAGRGGGYACSDVHLAGGVIAAIYPAAAEPPPAGATVVAGTDRLLLPGLHNAHTHSNVFFNKGAVQLGYLRFSDCLFEEQLANTLCELKFGIKWPLSFALGATS